MDAFDAASPLDARYYLPEADFYQRLHPYVSEAAQVKYLARVEAGLAATLADLGVCSAEAAAAFGSFCNRAICCFTVGAISMLKSSFLSKACSAGIADASPRLPRARMAAYRMG